MRARACTRVSAHMHACAQNGDEERDGGADERRADATVGATDMGEMDATQKAAFVSDLIKRMKGR